MDIARLMPGARVLRLLDIALALWVAAWIGLGVAIGVNVDELSSLSHTVVVQGRAVETVGGSLKVLGSVPLVGSELGEPATEVQRAGASAVASGTSSGSSIHTLSVLLAIAVALLPSIPVFGFYLPARVRRSRESRALRAAVALHGADPEFQAFLARRAIAALDYDRLRRISPSPWDDVRAGRCSGLAAAELSRLGIDPVRLQRRQVAG
jgi:hypothetical protein